MKPGVREQVAERRAKAIELRKAGTSYRDIARELGCSLGVAQNDIAHCLRELRERGVRCADQHRALEAARLDSLWSAAYPQAMAGDLQAIATCLRISESRCRLEGLYQQGATSGDIVGTAIQINVRVSGDDGEQDDGELIDAEVTDNQPRLDAVTETGAVLPQPCA